MKSVAGQKRNPKPSEPQPRPSADIKVTVIHESDPPRRALLESLLASVRAENALVQKGETAHAAD